MSIFVSYNHKDQSVAFKIKDKLTAAGFEVLIDVEKMQTGQDIEQFILHSIKESGVTLCLISANSLMSAWVTMETIFSQTDTTLRDRFFIPCFIDWDFFDRRFTGRALEKIDAELNEISELMKTSLEKGWGIEDLQNERTRYNKMKSNLPEIIGKLRNSLCIDLTPEKFEMGIQKIVQDLKDKNGTIERTKLIKAETAESIDGLQNLIKNTLDEQSKQRLVTISRRLSSLNELLDKYEQQYDFETEPRRRMSYEKEIVNIKNAIQKTLDEINSLS